MSRDTPRPPHETAREYASTGSTAPVRDPEALNGWGIAHHNLAHSTTRPRPPARLRGAAGAARFRADLQPCDDLAKRSGDGFRERV